MRFIYKCAQLLRVPVDLEMVVNNVAHYQGTDWCALLHSAVVKIKGFLDLLSSAILYKPNVQIVAINLFCAQSSFKEHFSVFVFTLWLPCVLPWRASENQEPLVFGLVVNFFDVFVGTEVLNALRFPNSFDPPFLGCVILMSFVENALSDIISILAVV